MKKKLSLVVLTTAISFSCKQPQVAGEVKSANVVTESVIAGTGFYDYDQSDRSAAPEIHGEFFSDEREARAVNSERVGGNILDSLALDQKSDVTELGFFIYMDVKKIVDDKIAALDFKTSFLLVNSEGEKVKEDWPNFYADYERLKSTGGKAKGDVPELDWNDIIPRVTQQTEGGVTVLRVGTPVEKRNLDLAMDPGQTGASGLAAGDTVRHIFIEKFFKEGTYGLKEPAAKIWDSTNPSPAQKIYLIALVRDSGGDVQGLQVLALPHSWMPRTSQASTSKTGEVSEKATSLEEETPELAPVEVSEEQSIEAKTPVVKSSKKTPDSDIDDVAAQVGASVGHSIKTTLKRGVTKLNIRSEPNSRSKSIVGSIAGGNSNTITVQTTCIESNSKSNSEWCWYVVRDSKYSSCAKSTCYVYSKYLVGGKKTISSSAGAGGENVHSEDRSFQSHLLPAGQHGPWLVRYRVILPKGFNPNKKYGVVYFLHGRGGDRFMLESLGVLAALNDYIDRGGKKYIMIGAEGGDSYWTDAALKSEPWGRVVTEELIQQVEEHYPVIKNSSGRIIAGISMGGHGAIQLALNHPGLYGAIAAHSPVFRTQAEASRDFPQQFGTGDAFQDRDPFSLILFKGKSIEVPLWIDIGGSDFAFSNTKNFSNLVRQRGYQAVMHIGEDLVGAHEIGYWKFHLQEYLTWYGQHLPITP
jgi:S-formylglutathione hydrolase FrmB